MGLQNTKPNRIGIDMRMAGTGEGIARYVEELVKRLAEIDRQNQYYLLCRKNFQFPISNSQFRNITVASPYYSFAEQTRFVTELNRLKLDLVHFPSFNAPILYRGKFVATIHDLIHHRFPGKKKSRIFHRLAYKAVMRSAVSRAEKIMTVSKATRDDLRKIYRQPDDRFEVIYEGVDDRFRVSHSRDSIEQVKRKFDITKPYLLFVGVWRQYKNLPRLARAFSILREKHGLDIQLVLAGKIDPFYPEIEREVFATAFAEDIRALGFVSDDELPALYQGASVFVLPSLVEGFGLIGAEAQASGVPVVGSDIPVLREVLAEGAEFFDPLKPDEMADKISQILTQQTLAERLRRSGLANSKRFDWKNTAEQTLRVYNEVLDGKN